MSVACGVVKRWIFSETFQIEIGSKFEQHTDDTSVPPIAGLKKGKRPIESMPFRGISTCKILAKILWLNTFLVWFILLFLTENCSFTGILTQDTSAIQPHLSLIVQLLWLLTNASHSMNVNISNIEEGLNYFEDFDWYNRVLSVARFGWLP